MHGGTLTPEGGPETEFRGVGGDATLSYLLLPTISVGMIAGMRSMTIGTTRRTTGWGLLGVFYLSVAGDLVRTHVWCGAGGDILVLQCAERGLLGTRSLAVSGDRCHNDVSSPREGTGGHADPRNAEAVPGGVAIQHERRTRDQSRVLGGLQGRVQGRRIGRTRRTVWDRLPVCTPASRSCAVAPSAVENRFGGVALVIEL